ncbi:uncharacterized protein LOC129272293 [Lytechinus pictus]|uniref:uncharacterized protein LOC129272293 n=1 Tax=Lytechinus pictus TaxID=7653 RepID=UPI0030BA1E02
MAEETQDKIHEGYLITGEQKDVSGGCTVNFQKKNKVYFVLWKRGEHLYNLEGFSSETSFRGKRKSSLNILGGRKKSISSGSIPSHILTSAVKVHCMDMTIGKKTSHVIVLVHAKMPYYFKPLKDGDLKPWFKAFSRVASDMENRRLSGDTVILRPKKADKERTGNDSGRFSSSSSSTRSSQGSSDGRLSDLINSCPPSPSFIPTIITVETTEPEDCGQKGDDDHLAPLPSGQRARRELSQSVIYKRRVRKDSHDEKTGGFVEADPKVYDSFIRKSVVIVDDNEGDIRPPIPQKKGRRGSVPSLPVTDLTQLYLAKRHSPELARGSTFDASESPPPLPARPNNLSPPYYVNTQRRASVPFTMSPINSQYEQCEKVKEDISRLMWEQSKDMDGIVIIFSKAELLDSLVLCTIEDAVWIAGWKKDLNNQLYGKLHVGDKVRQINAQVVYTAESAMQFISTSAGDEVSVTLYRLPHANVLNLNRSDPMIQWGIQLKSHNEIKSLTDGPAVTEGLTPKAKGALSNKPCDWVITEISHQRVPLVKSAKNQDFVKAELEANHKEIPMVVQPHDLVKKLIEAIEKKRSSQFT